MGVPVISTRQNGACEIMTDGVHGFVLGRRMMGRGCGGDFKFVRRRDTRRDAQCLALRPGLAYAAHLETLLAIYGRR